MWVLVVLVVNLPSVGSSDTLGGCLEQGRVYLEKHPFSVTACVTREDYGELLRRILIRKGDVEI